MGVIYVHFAATMFILPCLFVLDTICVPSVCVKIATVLYCNVCA